MLDVDPDNPDAQAALDSILTERTHAAFNEAKFAAVAGRRKKALELVDEFLRSETDNAEAWILRSHLSIGLGEKVESLQRALEIDPENSAARSAYDFLTATIGTPQESPESAGDVSEAVPKAYEEPVEEPCVFVSEPAESLDIAAQPDKETEFIPAVQTSTIYRVEELQPLNAPKTPLLEDYLPLHDNAVEFVPAPESPAYEEVREFDVTPETMIDDAETLGSQSICPYCEMPNESQAFSCATCFATLSLSDIESLLNNQSADQETIQKAVTQMEAEWNLRDFSETELVQLGIGYFNLGDHEAGVNYIREASRLDPNNVILSGQLNTITIRLDEIRRQNEAHDAMPRGKRILVVDDSATVRKLISSKLEKSGHHVVCAEDGVEALERLEEGLPDLVLLDISMPRMDGYEVCKKIRDLPEAKELPVVMISGKDGFFDKVRGRMAGSTGYVTKPFGPETLMKALETYLLPEPVVAD